jgi:hypothetical protein
VSTAIAGSTPLSAFLPLDRPKPGADLALHRITPSEAIMSKVLRSYPVWIFVCALTTNAIGVSSAAAQSMEPCELSREIQFVPEIRPLVERMLASSATFRGQYCRAADAPGLMVGVVLDPSLPVEIVRSRTTIRRYQSGLIVAIVAIAPGRRQEEWIAHEFEHILEQLEGVDLPALAVAQAGRVWSTGTGMFETARAVEAGRTVLSELHRSPPPASASHASE